MVDGLSELAAWKDHVTTLHVLPTNIVSSLTVLISRLIRSRNEVQHRATNLLDGCRTFGPENLLTETSDLKRRLDAALEDLEGVQGKYDKLRGSLALIDIRIAAKWVHLYHRARLARVRKVHNAHTAALKRKIAQLTVSLARSNMAKGGAGGLRPATSAGTGGRVGNAGRREATMRHFEAAAASNAGLSTFLRVGTGPAEQIDLDQMLPAPPAGADPGEFIPRKLHLAASRPGTAATAETSSSRPGTGSGGSFGGGLETSRPGTSGGVGRMEHDGGDGGGGDPAAVEASRRAAEIRHGASLRESRQQSRDKAVVRRGVSTPQQVAAGEVPLRALEVLLPDNREMYTEGEVTEWRLAHLTQMQALQEAFEERLQLCAEFWRGRYAAAVAAAADQLHAGNTGAGRTLGKSSRGGSGGGLHRPLSSTTQGGAGDQVKIQALPFVYPKSKPWPRKGGAAEYFEHLGDENLYSSSGRAATATGHAREVTARITGRRTDRPRKQDAASSAAASPDPGRTRPPLAKTTLRPQTSSGAPGAGGGTVGRHGAGFHARWSTPPVRASHPVAPMDSTGGHNFLGSRG